MAVDEDLRTKLATIINDATIPIEEGKVSDTRARTRVWYRRANSNTDVFIGGNAGLTETRFDIEVHGENIATVQTLAASIKALHSAGGLNGLSGAFGSSSVLGIFVEDHSDDYEPKGGFETDTGLHVCSLDVQVIEA